MKRLSRTASGIVTGGLLLVCLIGACAPNPAPDTNAAEAGAADGVSIFTVRNNHSDGRDMVIYLEPAGREERRTLGTVAAGATATFDLDAARGYYTMIAAHNLGEVTSNRFNLPGPSTVTWTLQPSRVVVSTR